MKPKLLVNASFSVFIVGLYAGPSVASDAAPVGSQWLSRDSDSHENVNSEPDRRLAKASKKVKKKQKDSRATTTKSKRKTKKNEEIEDEEDQEEKNEERDEEKEDEQQEEYEEEREDADADTDEEADEDEDENEDEDRPRAKSKKRVNSTSKSKKQTSKQASTTTTDESDDIEPSSAVADDEPSVSENAPVMNEVAASFSETSVDSASVDVTSSTQAADVAAAEVATTAVARTVEADPGWGPKKGDFGLAFDAVPMMNFALNAVNIFGDTGQQAAGLVNWPQGFENTITLKYMMSDNLGIRTLFGANVLDRTSSTFYPHPIDVADPEILPGDEIEIEDKLHESTSGFWLGGGFEFRDTLYERLQGYGGMLAVFGMSGSSSNTQYGWAYDTDAADFGVIGEGTTRPLKTDSGLTSWFSARAFVGVEFFVLPQVSLGAEYGLSMTFASKGRGMTTTEVWRAEDNKAEIEEEEGSSSGSNVLVSPDIGNAMGAEGQGSLFLSVYF